MRPRAIMPRWGPRAPGVGGIDVDASRRTRIAALALVLAIGLGPAAARAQQEDGGYEDAGLGAASAFSTLLYGPVKVVFAITGLVIGPFAWALSAGDADVMWKVINTSVRGDYVVTPAHLRGEQPLEFFGRDPGYGT
jgi:hypothetical protein